MSMKKVLFIICLLFLSAPMLFSQLTYDEEGFIHPFTGESWVTSEFGYREPVMGGRAEGDLKLHRGVDLVGGREVRASRSGIVVEHWPAPNGYFKGHPVYGGLVVIDHGFGVMTLYAHLSRTFVSEGQEIKQGEILGYVGSTGISTGPHLHFELLVDPILYIQSREGRGAF